MSLAASIGPDPAVHTDAGASQYQSLALAPVQETLDVRYRRGLRDMGERVDISR